MQPNPYKATSSFKSVVATECFARGGARWGQSFRKAANASWPLATLRITPYDLEIEIKLWPIVRRFQFTRNEVVTLKKRRGLVSVGVQIEHARSDYPPFILFWSFQRKRLLATAEAAGYLISD